MKILYEGVDIYPDISVHRCYHDMYAEKQSDELLLKLNDTRELWDSWNPKKGDTIAIEDGAAKTGKMFVESVVPESGIITLRAYSVPQSAKDKRSKSWEKVKFLQLAQEIAGRHGLTLETYGITDQTYDYVEQNNLADFAFFQNRCTLEGAAFLVYDGKLVVYDEAYMESQQPVDTITITPANDFEYVDDVVDAYIRTGVTALGADWLSKTSGGAALTPESDKIYVILSEGEYQNKTYRWSGTTYAVIGNDLAIGETASTAYRGDRGKTAYDHSQSAHAPADAEKNVQSDWNETDGNSDAFIKNKPAIPKAVTKTVQTLSDAASKSFTVTGYILSVILIDSVTKEQVIGDVSFENATASANGKVTVTLAAAPSNPILVIITSIAL